MDGEKDQGSWWHTIPGIFTAIAGVITAITGLIVGLHQAGMLDIGNKPVQSPPSSRVSSPTAPTQGDPAVSNPPLANSPAVAAEPAVSISSASRINLLAPENGGQIILASSSDWSATIDGKETWGQISSGIGQMAVYAFKDERPALIDSFALLINEAGDNNIKEFELLAGNGSPTGDFQSIGKFQTQNLKLFKTPYQEFKFPPVRAKYVKFKILSTYGSSHPIVYEFRLNGKLE